MTSPRSIALVAAAVLLSCANVASAAPLCRGSKGQFTPCAKGEIGSEPIRISRGFFPREAKVKTAAEQPGSDMAAAGQTTAPRITISKLCHDSKGLFTPCPR